MNAFEVSRWINILGRGHSPMALDESSLEAVKELFKVTAGIKAAGDDDRKEFWLSAKRGSLEEFREYYDDDDTDEEELKADMLAWFPDEVMWYSFISVHHDGVGEEFYGVFVGNKYVLAVNDCNAGGWPIDATPFINWLIEETKKVINEVATGKYNDRIAEQLPYKYKEGTILRKDYWDIYPELRMEYRNFFSESVIKDFMETAESFDCDKTDPERLYKEITARQFYEACSIGYKAIGREPRACWRYKESEEERNRYGGVTPKEYYYMYADCRDDGLINVPMDNAEAFAEWLNEKGPYYKFNGHHPWEIIPSGSIAFSLHMFVRKTDGGYYLELSGDKFERSIDTVRFYLAIKKAGFPVYLYNADVLKARFDETDEIGILPTGIYSPYISNVNGKYVADTVHLKNDIKEPIVIAKADWQTEPKVSLEYESFLYTLNRSRY